MCKRRFPCTSQSSGQQLRSIRHSVPATTFQTLIVFLVLSVSDYGNAVLTGLPVYLFRRLQSGDERGSTAHLRPASLRPHLRRAHQPPLAPGSGVKTAVLMYKSTHGTAPSYPSQLVRVADLPGRRSLRSALTNHLLVPSVKLSTIGGRAFPIAGPTV